MRIFMHPFGAIRTSSDLDNASGDFCQGQERASGGIARYLSSIYAPNRRGAKQPVSLL
jgi:hypothetical protein